MRCVWINRNGIDLLADQIRKVLGKAAQCSKRLFGKGN
jgi:hypothetical protein